MDRRKIILAVALHLYLLLSLYVAISPASFDPYYHAEIAKVYSDDPMSETYGVYSDTPITYPPFFHYISILVSMTGLSLI